MTIRRLRSILWRVPVEQEVREELAHHRDLRSRELIDRGWNPADAEAEAARRVAGVAPTLQRLGADRNRSFARREWLDELTQDLSFAFRQCRVNPGFTLAAVLTLALGLGATTAIFSVVNAVVLRPFPFSEPDRVLAANTTWGGRPSSTSAGNYDYLRQRLTTLQHFAAIQFSNFNLSDDGDPERVAGQRVSWNYFPVFGVAPLHGRAMAPEEDQPGRASVVVLSYRLWMRRFGGVPSLIGRTIRMSGELYTVIGIMPESFDGDASAGAELWVPIAFTPERLAMYDEHYLQLVARRRADVSLAQVNDDLMRGAQGLVRDHPDFNRERGASAQTYSDFFIGSYRNRLFILLSAVGVVLIIACGNVANLLLARLATRSRELAIRGALGAGRGRIVRQVLTESLVLAVVGGGAGLLVARWSLPALMAMAPTGVPRLRAATLDPMVLAVACGLVLVSTLFVGALPAWQATRRTELKEELGDGKGSGHGSLKPWIRQTLIGAQAALVLVVLAGAALLIRSALNLQLVPIGFDTSGVVTARVTLPGAQYASADEVQLTFQQILENVMSASGVQFAALDSGAPLTNTGGGNGLLPEGKPFTGDRINSQAHFVTPDYFQALRIPIKAGRGFTDADTRLSPLVMIINETLARAAYGDGDPIGKRMVCCEGSPEDPRWKLVVGVVPDVRGRGPAQAATPEFYLPVRQIPDAAWTWVGRTLSIVVRGSDTASSATAIRSGVRQADATLPIFGLQTMNDGMRRVLSQSRFNTLLMSLLGAIGLILAALGIYSVIAWLAAQRAREIGVRMALGASALDVISMMTAHGLKPVVVGLAVGLAAALALTRMLQSELFNVSPRDPLTLVTTAIALFVVAGFAAIVPAWRATRVDPASALRD
ncbi:MAG: ABC transporter permease [Vicinamibacterales bacterium]